MNTSKATEALSVAQEITAIRAALIKRGYRIRKRPKQAAWSVYATNDQFLRAYLPTHSHTRLSQLHEQRLAQLSPHRTG